MHTPALDVLRTKTAFWGGAVNGLLGAPMSWGQRSAVQESPRELTDAQYDSATGGASNAMATVPRTALESLLGAGIGAGAGLLGHTIMDGHYGSSTMLNAQPEMIGGALAGGIAGGAHGAYRSAKNITAENIENIDSGETVGDRHPWQVGAGAGLTVAGAGMNPLTIPVGAALGGIGHGIEALRGRAHSYTHDPANEVETADGVVQTNPDAPGSMWQNRVRTA